MIHTGDCIEVMRTLPAESVDAVVTDPPAGVHFMSKNWDHDKGGRTEWVAWMTDVMRECYRVLKPGGYAVVWSLPRTCHWTAWAMEDAGFIIRDQLAHIFASGFPKGKAQLKPAREDWWLARKPGPLRPLGIDASRIPSESDTARKPSMVGDTSAPFGKGYEMGGNGSDLGRWPSNVLLSDPALFDEPNPEVVGSGATDVGGGFGVRGGGGDGEWNPTDRSTHRGQTIRGGGEIVGYGDSGGYSRFFTYPRYFLIPKSSRADREPVVRGQVAERDAKKWNGAEGHKGVGDTYPDGSPRPALSRANNHPTVKPVDLMRHLIRLVTPSGGTVLDCFAGSGSTLIAAELEGFPWIGIEQSAEYVAIAEARLNGTQRGLGLDVPAPTRKQVGKWDDNATAKRHQTEIRDPYAFWGERERPPRATTDKEPAA